MALKHSKVNPSTRVLNKKISVDEVNKIEVKLKNEMFPSIFIPRLANAFLHRSYSEILKECIALTEL